MFFHYHKVAREYRKVCELFRPPPITYLFKSLRFPPGLIYAKEVSSAIMKKKERREYILALPVLRETVNKSRSNDGGRGWGGNFVERGDYYSLNSSRQLSAR